MSDPSTEAPAPAPATPAAPVAAHAHPLLTGIPVDEASAHIAHANPGAGPHREENLRIHRERELAYVALLRDRFGVEHDPAKINEGGPLIPRARHFELARTLKEELGYRFYSTVCATHFLASKGKAGEDSEHFEVATVLRTIGAGTHQAVWRVRLEVGEDLDSLVPLFAGADWQEREQFDLVGVVFRGHPDLRRLMMPDEWEGHPLRKDYAIETRCAPWR